MNTASLIKNMDGIVKKHASEVLTGMGIAGMITSTGIAVMATPKALRLIEMRKKKDNKERLTILETIQTAGRCYIPTVILIAVSTGCLISSNSINKRTNAALVTAYEISESAAKLYRDKVVETIGEKKEQQVQDSVAKERIDNHPVGTSQVIVTGNGTSLCFDVISGRYFESSVDKLRKAEYEINRKLISEDYASLNDLYEEIGLPPIPVGDNMGWNVRKDKLEFKFSSQLTEDDKPCLVVGYEVAPNYTYF